MKPNIEIIYDSENPKIQDILSRLEYKRSFDNKDVFSFTEPNQSQVVSVVKELLHTPLDHPKTIVIELEQDDQFFNLLIQELEDATEMQDKTAQRFQKDIGVLESNLTQVTSPGSDMYVWRKIFSIYMDACIFSGTVEVSKRQMQWFLTQCRGVVKKSSKRAFEQFVALNTELITIQHYQSLNQTAMRKILKKHDKQSGLSASEVFQPLGLVMLNPKLAKMMYAMMTEKVTNIIPQPDDYGNISFVSWIFFFFFFCKSVYIYIYICMYSLSCVYVCCLASDPVVMSTCVLCAMFDQGSKTKDDELSTL